MTTKKDYIRRLECVALSSLRLFFVFVTSLTFHKDAFTFPAISHPPCLSIEPWFFFSLSSFSFVLCPSFSRPQSTHIVGTYRKTGRTETPIGLDRRAHLYSSISHPLRSLFFVLRSDRLRRWSRPDFLEPGLF